MLLMTESWWDAEISAVVNHACIAGPDFVTVKLFVVAHYLNGFVRTVLGVYDVVLMIQLIQRN